MGEILAQIMFNTAALLGSFKNRDPVVVTQLRECSVHFHPSIPALISQGKLRVRLLCLCVSAVCSENSFICLSVNKTQTEETALFYFIKLDI